MIEIFAQFLMKSILVMVVLLPVCSLFLTLAIPKDLLDRYLCPPHFSLFESRAYSCFPSNFTLTNILCFAIAFPFYRRFRSLDDINKNVPSWFNIASRFYVYVILGYSFFCISMMAILASLIKQGVL